MILTPRQVHRRRRPLKASQDGEPVETLDLPARCEVRMMYLWLPEGPRLVNNLVRMTKGAMVGVDFNKDKTWVGASIALHPPVE
ncbi:MAG TPA: hypothetical protein VN851_12660 [Thermoanaerobaculia bacterium]|nr:hypothetical protein [Thermoanaerobaculia bacterium]